MNRVASFRLLPDHVDITFIAYSSFLGGMLWAIAAHLRDRSKPFPTAPSFRGAVFGAAVGTAIVVLELVRQYA